VVTFKGSKHRWNRVDYTSHAQLELHMGLFCRTRVTGICSINATALGARISQAKLYSQEESKEEKYEDYLQ